MTPAEASDRLQDASNDYSIQRDRYFNLEVLEQFDPDLCQALQQWSDRPDLPALPGLFAGQ